MSQISIAPKIVIEACFGPDGTAELETVYDVAAAVGISDQPVRLAIRRLESQGVLDQVGRGRKGRLVLTESGRARERQDTEHLAFAYSQDAGESPWNELWYLYTFSVPEKIRSQRDSLRTALVRLGAAALANGVYVSPFDLRMDLAHEVLPATITQYLITAEAAMLEGPGLGNPQRVVETLWPAADIEAAYEGLAEVLTEEARLTELSGSSARLAYALRLAVAFTHALERDPLIPRELRGPEWSPPALRSRFRETWERLRRDLPEITLFSAYELPSSEPGVDPLAV